MEATMTIPEDITWRVKTGAAYLDEAMPGWWREDHVPRIDLIDLDLESSCYCTLGQLARGKRTTSVGYLNRYERMSRELGIVVNKAIRLGFAEAEEDEQDYPDLTAAWRTLIGNRRAEALR